MEQCWCNGIILQLLCLLTRHQLKGDKSRTVRKAVAIGLRPQMGKI